MREAKTTGIKDAVIEEICALAGKHRLQKVILFGSRARGDYWRASDIDLAVSQGRYSAFFCGCGRGDVHAAHVRRSESG